MPDPSLTDSQTVGVVAFWFALAVPFILWCRRCKVPSRRFLERNTPDMVDPRVLRNLRKRLVTKVIADLCLLIGVVSAFSLGWVAGILAGIVGSGLHLFVSDTPIGGIAKE